MELSYSHSNLMIKSSHGCWTCRLRRKKCDARLPVCDVCSGLLITCHHGNEKPEWMDGGVKQGEMAERIKLEVKENAYLRRAGRATITSSDTWMNTASKPHDEEAKALPLQADPSSQRGTDCALAGQSSSGRLPFSRSDTILVMFYLEHLFPFFFPFYKPSLLQGGRVWVLELMMSSPVMRRATLCQSAYFYALARGPTIQGPGWETVLQQTKDAFEMLRQSLQVIIALGIKDHLHGAVRILSSIMQVQRFEIALFDFENCRLHLDAAIVLFNRIVEVGADFDSPELKSNFHIVLDRLGEDAESLPAHETQIPSAEQAAFQFSSSLLIFDDIIASTISQEQPRIYSYSHDLLAGDSPAINFETTVGCQNWVILQIAEIAVLDSWKKDCKRLGNLDGVKLASRGAVIKESLESHLRSLEKHPGTVRREPSSLLELFQQNLPHPLDHQTILTTSIWAHAALIYLLGVVSGWNLALSETSYHVAQITRLLSNQELPPTIVRAMLWPFCIAGFVAAQEQEVSFHILVEVTQPTSVFGTTRKALELMQRVWRRRDDPNLDWDIASCFRAEGNNVLVLLV